MILPFFRRYQPAVLIAVLLISVILWLKPFLLLGNNQGAFSDSMPLFQLLNSLLKIPGLSLILAFLFTLTVAFLLIRLNTLYIFIIDRSYLPALVYVVLIAGTGTGLQFSPAIISSLLVVYAIQKLIDTLRTDKIAYEFFDSSIVLSVASLFYYPLIFFLPLIWFVLIFLKSSRLKEWIYTIVGFLFPYGIYVFVLFILNKPIDEFLQGLIKKYFESSLSFADFFCLKRIIFLGLTGIITIVASFTMAQSIASKKNHARKTFYLFLIIFIVCIALLFFVPVAHFNIIILAFIPLSFLISHQFYYSRTIINEVLFILFLLGGIINSILPW
jgi:hypothetical protein